MVGGLGCPRNGDAAAVPPFAGAAGPVEDGILPERVGDVHVLEAELLPLVHESGSRQAEEDEGRRPGASLPARTPAEPARVALCVVARQDPDARIGGRARRGAFAFAMAALVAVGASADEARVQDARDAAERTLQEVVDILQAEGLSLGERRERVTAIAYERFDFRTISRLVVGRPWRRFSDEQRERFIEDFKRLLSTSYGGRIGRYEDGEVRVVGARSEPRGDVTVRTRISGGNADGIRVDYRMRKKDDGSWGVIDVVAEGVSLVSSYRSQFAGIVSRGGPDELLRRLEKKIAEQAEQAEKAEESGGEPAADAGEAG